VIHELGMPEKIKVLGKKIMWELWGWLYFRIQVLDREYLNLPIRIPFGIL
jgi:hypothetical protein